MPGFKDVLKGILAYNKSLRPQMVEQFKRVRDQPKPKSVMFTCMDSRLLITQLLSSRVGDMFVVRNAGNLIPHSKLFSRECISTVPVALEIGVVNNDVGHVFICGHSDCKAMHALYNMADKPTDSPTDMWLRRHASASLTKFEQLIHKGNSEPLTFQADAKNAEIKAYIDPDNQFAPVDKLSQVNTLQQLQNIASYSFLHDKLTNKELKLHAMWFDVYTGDFYMFSRDQQRFIEIDEASAEQLEKGMKNW